MVDGLIKVRDLFHENVIFGVGALLLTSFWLGTLCRRLKLPTISGYIVAGLLLGPDVFRVVHENVAADLEPIPHIALGLIALSIGGRFPMQVLRRIGRGTLMITLTQLVGTFVLVSVALVLVARLPASVALALGAIATATAPAATLAVIQEYRAKGELVDTLLATVALDDAGCVILFSLTLAMVGALTGAGFAVVGAIWQAVREIGGSVVIGLIEGLLIHLLIARRRDAKEIIIVVLGLLFVSSAIAMELHLSQLMTNMVAGCVLVNLDTRNDRIFRMLEPLEAPVYAAFFAIAGAEFRMSVLYVVGLAGVVYIAARAVGKVGGAWVGAVIAGTPDRIRRHIGVCLLPQAGVAIGLVLLLQENRALREIEVAGRSAVELMVAVVLFSVLINELVGPSFTRHALIKSGEARPLEPGVVHHGESLE